MSFTPGPWFYSQESVDPEWYIVTIEGGLIVANVNAHVRQEANARLVSAAPDLFRAAKMALDCARSVSPEMTKAYAALQDALSKAEGHIGQELAPGESAQ